MPRRLDRLSADRGVRARISGSFDFLDPRGESGDGKRASEGERATRVKERNTMCHQIETFLGIGCQIESADTSAPYRSTRRRVCRMFNDGRGRFRVSETGPPNSLLGSARLGLVCLGLARLGSAWLTRFETQLAFVRVTIPRIKMRSSVIYIDAHERGTRVLQYFHSKVKICHVRKHVFNIS